MSLGVPSSSPRSHRGRRAGLTALLSGALIAGGIVVATTVASPAGAVPEFQDAGTLVLQTRNGVTTASMEDGTTQTFTTTSQCQLSSTGATFLRLGGQVGEKPGNVGFQNGTFGVAEKPSGTSCVEINANKQSSAETLIIKLGGSSTFPLLASSATLDIEAKGSGAKATVAFLLGGVSKGTQVIDCNATSSDSGPDAKNGDNCVETVAPAGGAKFDELRISASAGAAVSLEGGQDWVGVDSSVKTTFEVGYFGEAPVQCEARTVQVAGSATTPAVQVRDVSRSDSETCRSFVYSLTSTGGTATFLKPYSEQSDSLQFMMDLEWTIAAGEAAALPPVQFGFHDRFLNPGVTRTLGWCANSTFELASGGQPTITQAMDVEPPRADGSDPFPGVQYACMMPPELRKNTVGTPTSWFQSIYVHGDAYARR